MSGITDLGANAAAQASNNEQNGDYESEWDPFDVSGLSFAKQHPTTAVMGDAVSLRYFPDWDNDEPDRGDFGLVIDNPGIYTGEGDLEGSRIFVSTEDTGDDFKVVNVDDEATQILEGSGVDFAGNLFYGEEADEFGEDQIVLKATGSSGRSIASTLDVMGGTGARSVGSYDDEDVVLHGGGFPEHNGGLIEYHPDGRDGERPRVSRHTQLRSDVEGQTVVVMLQRLAEIDEDYDGPAYWATVFADVEDDRMQELAEEYAESNRTSDDAEPEDFIADVAGEEMIQLRPTTDFEPDPDLVRETGYISWNRVDLDELNEAREAEGLDPYEPGEQSDTDEAEAEAE